VEIMLKCVVLLLSGVGVQLYQNPWKGFYSGHIWTQNPQSTQLHKEVVEVFTACHFVLWWRYYTW